MLKRCIMIFPEFMNMEVIQGIRRQYDPLVLHVKPHITLVFPFASSIESDELRSHIADVISGIPPFRVKLSGITAHVDRSGHYLFLNVVEGCREITAIHSRLYGGILKPHQPPFLQKGYTPHLTLGRLDTTDAYLQAVNAVASLAD
jgi:2'-5' RNA ligase